MVSSIAQEKYQVRMAFIGNSITFGANLTDPSNECYPSQLRDMLAENFGDTVQIMNCGVSGRTMMRSAESPIWIEGAFKNGIKFVPDICLIMLGTNDAKPYRWEAWGDEFLDDYLAMIDTFKFRNPNTKFIVCYPPPIWPGHPYGTSWENLHNDTLLMEQVVPAIDTVVDMTGATLIDFHTPFLDSVHLFPDLLHPNAEAQRQMAAILYDTIMKYDMIHQVEAGLAYISDFTQSRKEAVGSPATLTWTTMFANTVLLDGEQVELNGSKEVVAEEGKVYTLTATGDNNTSTFDLHMNTYVPVASALSILVPSSDYKQGYPVYLISKYLDQLSREMTEPTSNIAWSITDGEGELKDANDTSVVFQPTALGYVTIEARQGDMYKEKKLRVDELTSVDNLSIETISVYPNPVKERLYLQLDNTTRQDVEVSVFSILGKPVINRNFNISGQTSPLLELSTDELESGVYLYSVGMGGETFFGRFFKE